MSSFKRSCGLLGLVLVVGLGAAPVWAARPTEPAELYKAYFLEHREKDCAAAEKLYQSVLKSDVPREIKVIAQAGANRCRDSLAAENFASLMPEATIFYAELKRPGQVLEDLCRMLGIAGKDMQQLLTARPSAESSAPFYLPDEIAISPALFEAFKGFGGLAVAITDFDPSEDKPPKGVMVIHHGDSDLLRGLLETAFQFSPTAEKIADLPTFSAPAPDIGKVVGVLTDGLFIVGTSHEEVEGVVGRLLKPGSASLGSSAGLKQSEEERAGAALFAYADLQAVMKIAKADMSEHDLRDFNVANTLADLDSLRWASFSAGIHDGAMSMQLAVRLADDHHSMAYNLLRLPPMTQQCLEKVPAESAALFAFGLNPALTYAAADAAYDGASARHVTGLDIGREFFANIREACVFVVPGKVTRRNSRSGPPIIPNIGLVLAVNDVQRSKALWDQFLSIPGLVAGPEPTPPQASKIGSTEATAYAIPDFGKIYLAELDDCIVLGSSRIALKAIAQTHRRGQSILKDPTFARVFDKMPEDTSMMFVAHAGRLANVAASAQPEAAFFANQAEELCGDTLLWGAIGQAPAQLTISAALSGLPDLNRVLKQYKPMINAFAGAAVQAHHHEARVSTEGKAKDKPKDKAKSKAKRKAEDKADNEQDVNKLTSKVLEAANKDDCERALKYALKAREIKDSGLTNYNVACMYSRLDRADEAFEYLFRAVELGMPDSGRDIAELMKTDSDFDNIRDNPRFEKALKQAQGGGKAKADKPRRPAPPARKKASGDEV